MPLFNPILRFVKQAQSLSIDYVMQELFKDKKVLQFIIDLNTKNQLYNKGIDSEGEYIKPFYTLNTINIKTEKGQITDHVTLKDTGAFYKSFSIILTSDNDFQITADSIKDGEDLLKKYGKEVLGLTDDNLIILIDYVRPRIVKIVRKKLKIAA